MIQGVGKFDYQPATQLEGGRSHDTMQVEHMAGRTAGSIPPDPSFLPSFQKPLLARALPPPLTQLAMAFTSKQRAELEHQVLLTKYLVANVPIPQELLVPLGNPRPHYDRFNTKSPFFSSLSIRDMLAGSGGTPAPQQARCLRTDGKKWQCKKLVVSGQKYCEKHMHRGRHRAANKRGEGSPGPPMSANRQKDASGDSRSDSPSSQDRSKASDSQPLKEGSGEGSIKRAKLEKRDSLNSRERPGSQLGDKAAAQQRSRSPALPQAHLSRAFAELNSRFPDPSLSIRPPVAQAGFRELYPAPQYQFPGPPGQAAPQLSYPFAGLSPLEQDRIQDLLQRSVRKPGPLHEPQRGPGPPVPKFDNVGIPPLSSQVFSNGHAASFASTRINRDGTVAPDASDIAMAMLLRQERTRLDREAIQAGLDYGAMTSSYMDPRDQSLRLLFEDYRSAPAMPSAQAWMQPQVSPSSPSQWQLATSGMTRDAQGTGRLPRAFSRDSMGLGAQHQQGFAGGHSPKQKTIQRQGSDPSGRNSLQCQPSDPLTLAGSGMPHAADNLPEGLPPHLAFLAQNNTDNGNMQPIDEERGLVRTHSLVKGGSLANRHGPHRSPLSRQPSLQNDDPEKPWLAVSTGLGDWGTDRGGPLGEALRRTTSGTPIQPHEKPGERPPAKEAPNTEFDILGDQFVSEPLGLELPPQADLPKTAVCEDQQIPNDPSMERDFQPFSLDGETSSPTTESRGLESSGVEELGQANVSLTAVS